MGGGRGEAVGGYREPKEQETTQEALLMNKTPTSLGVKINK